MLEEVPAAEEPALDLSEPGDLAGSFLDEEPSVDVDIPLAAEEPLPPPAPEMAPETLFEEETPLSFAENDLGLEVEMDAEAEPAPVVAEQEPSRNRSRNRNRSPSRR